MGHIAERVLKDGSASYTAQVRIKRGGQIIYSEAETFARRTAAVTWMKNREAALKEPGALEKAMAPDPTLSEAIDTYLKDSKRDYGKTKRQVLNTIKASSLGGMKCSEIDSTKIVEFAKSLGVQPQTVGNYISHLSAIFAVARPAWGYPLDQQAMADARAVAGRLGLVSRSNERIRRPTPEELDALLEHFGRSQAKRVDALPMQRIIVFAIFSTRRQEEITRLSSKDLNEKHSEIIVRDMKHPGEKVGNDVTTCLTPEAMATLQLQMAARPGDRIFPHNADTISTSFTRACKILGIEDLHFHDLRHEGISWLFEMGWSIPRVATVSGHRTWKSLQRYAQIRAAGNRYEGWKWFERLGIDLTKASDQQDRHSQAAPIPMGIASHG